MKINLASKSPRRHQILKEIGIPFNPVESSCDEIVNGWEKPEIAVMGIALQKALSTKQNLQEGELIIAADTVVVLDNKILGKPKNKQHAKQMLMDLRGRKHKVITAYAIIEVGTNNKVIDYVSTDVLFKNYTDEIIEWYLSTNESEDKAGSYAIQGKGAVLVNSISGDYFNIVGFPISKIVDTLERDFNYSFV